MVFGSFKYRRKGCGTEPQRDRLCSEAAQVRGWLEVRHQAMGPGEEAVSRMPHTRFSPVSENTRKRLISTWALKKHRLSR
jgi:hypothetical protein